MCATPVETQRKNDGSDCHADKLDKEITKRLHGQGMFGIEYAQNYRGHDRNEDLKSNIISQLPFVRARRLVRFRFQGFPPDGPALVIGERLQ